MASALTDKQFVDWEHEVFGFGYGTGEMYTIPALRQFLLWANLGTNRTGYDHVQLERELGPTVTWLLINTLAHADIIEYGVSPRFGWLTERGRLLRDYMAARTVDQLQEVVTAADDDHVECFPGLCQCGRTPCNPLWRTETTKVGS